MNNERAELFDAYLRGEMTETDRACLKEILAGDSGRAAEFITYCLETGLMMRVGTQIEHARRSATEQPPWCRPAAEAQTGRSWWGVRRVAMAAAFLALAAAGVWWWRGSHAPAGLGVRVVEVAGEARMEDGRRKTENGGAEDATGQAAVSGVRRPVPAGSRPLVVGMELHQGDRVTVARGGKVALKYDGEATTLDLHSAAATLRAEDGAKRVRLDSGLLLCTAAPQPKPFRLEMPQGVATVKGTRFALAAEGGETTLAVREGVVALAAEGKTLDVKAGEIAVAAPHGPQALAAEDRWIRELLIRVEIGPWDAVDFGTGAFAQGNWRMDARGRPAERLLWNVHLEPEKGQGVVFDSARWKRGVVTGLFLVPGAGRAAPVPPVDEQQANPQMSVFVADMGANSRASFKALLYEGNREKSVGTGINLTDGRRMTPGVWYQLVLYFDTAAEAGPTAIVACWPVTAGGAPAASAWRVGPMSAPRQECVGFGVIVTPNEQVVVKGLKLVPLGADMPQPPAGFDRK